MVRPAIGHPIKRLLAAVFVGACLLAGCGSDPGPATIADLTPSPDVAADDKGPAILDGCRSGMEYTDAWSCVYGDASSATTVVLWGDSHAMQFSPPLIRLAEERGWRLVAMFRGNCLTAEVEYKPACDAWRANAMRRIKEEKPRLIVTATDTGNGYALWEDGVRLSRNASEPLLRQAYAQTLRKLSRFTGNRKDGVIVIRDLPRADFRPPDCLLEHPEDLAACDFKGYRKNPPGFDLAAAKKVAGVKLIDPSGIVCPAGICNSARAGMVIYRDTTHISATYASSLADWLGERIDSRP